MSLDSTSEWATWWDTPILGERVSDVITLFGLAGLIVTFWQVWKTRSATTQVLDALNVVNQKYRNHLKDSAIGLLNEAKALVRGNDFIVASVRVSDLGEILHKLSFSDPQFRELAESMIDTSATFQRIAEGRRAFSDSARGKWNRNCNAVMFHVLRDPIADPPVVVK